MNINERLQKIGEYYRMSVYAFSKSLDISAQRLSNYLKDREPDYQTLRSILNNFPEIDPIWLLTGEGEMLKNPNVHLLETPYIVVAPFITKEEQGDYLINHNRQGYLENLDAITFIVKGHSMLKLNMVAFECFDDSMFDGSALSLIPGSILLGLELERRRLLSSHAIEQRLRYILVEEDRIIIREIEENDKKSIKTRPLNEEYQEEIIEIKNIKQVFLVIQNLIDYSRLSEFQDLH